MLVGKSVIAVVTFFARVQKLLFEIVLEDVLCLLYVRHFHLWPWFLDFQEGSLTGRELLFPGELL
jgi:hypothetical protein